MSQKPTAEELRNTDRFEPVEVPKPQVYRDKATGKVYGLAGYEVLDAYLPLQLRDGGAPIDYAARKAPRPGDFILGSFKLAAAVLFRHGKHAGVYPAIRELFGDRRAQVTGTAARLVQEAKDAGQDLKAAFVRFESWLRRTFFEKDPDGTQAQEFTARMAKAFEAADLKGEDLDLVAGP